jgi:hypothetical protein
MSAITAYSSLVGDVLLGANPAPPEKIVERMLQQAGREFCMETGAWQETLDVIGLTAYQSAYTMAHSYSTNALIDRVVRATRDGNDLSLDRYEVTPPATFTFLPRFTPSTSTGISAYSAAATYAIGDKATEAGVNYRCREVISTPEAFDATKWTRIEDGLYLKVAFRPTYEAAYLPSWFFDRWARVFVYGARAELLAQAGTPWENPRGAQQAQTKFFDGINDGRREALMEHRGGDPIMVTPGAY